MTRLSRLSRSVEGHVVLITGAGSGIGRASAHLFADEGARVAVTDLGDGRVDAVVDEILSLIHISEPTRPLYISYAV